MDTRADGRSADELRRIRIEPHCNQWAEGSSLIECGLTRVVTTVSIEDRVPEWLRGKGEGWLTAEYSMLPRATHTRTAREATKGRPSGRTTEIQRLVGRALRAAFDRTAIGARTVFVDCDVLQADGGTRCAAINGAIVALALACRKLVDAGTFARWPLRFLVAAVSVGRVGGVDMLDLAYQEDSAADLDLNVVSTSHGKLLEVQGGAEGTAFDEADLVRCLALARIGAERIFATQRDVLKGVLEE